eukprot:CAMPEP_0202458418 /NCGR_PEP_ID=MMETSP1360-20130828/25023_1 /ASSEMBLY_ACC=CAM_ASM_000848 /TAXON_ID=515479 /ORGANISM="Licmophora paradoxa, Strain CCMP2313" /LENGTH=121 /DNA_ID=CAMNT_0049078949 /DNA_START=38 /DNA_END=403 /DNA_ORIENTATION=+
MQFAASTEITPEESTQTWDSYSQQSDEDSSCSQGTSDGTNHHAEETTETKKRDQGKKVVFERRLEARATSTRKLLKDVDSADDLETINSMKCEQDIELEKEATKRALEMIESSNELDAIIV